MKEQGRERDREKKNAKKKKRKWLLERRTSEEAE